MSELIDRTGEVNIASNGQKMTIIAYRTSRDIDIQFEDNTIVFHKCYSMFKCGSIKNPNLHSLAKKASEKHIGEQVKNIDGSIMTLIKWNNWGDITIRFDDGIILEHKTYDNFIKGTINKYYENHIGRTNKSIYCGLNMTIIAYRTNNDIDVQFEDGVIRTHTNLSNFVYGKIAHPNDIKSLNDYIGETSINTYGFKMTIIDYKSNHDFTIQFEDGTIKHCTNYNNFKNGSISHSKYNRSNIVGQSYIGKSNIMKNGLKATIISYNNANDITIQFEDNTIKKHCSISNWQLGNILHPLGSAKKLLKQKEYIGKSFITNNGLNMTITNYIDSRNIEVTFETGYKKDHKYISDITNGKVKHPFPYQMNSIKIEKFAYIDSNKIGNFYCTCTKCNHKDIWTIEEAKNHICKE